MSVDDLLFAPILPPHLEKKLRDLVQQIMNKPTDDKHTNGVANQIVDLFTAHGITNENEMVDTVHRIAKEMGGILLADDIAHHTMVEAKQREVIRLISDIFDAAATP